MKPDSSVSSHPACEECITPRYPSSQNAVTRIGPLSAIFSESALENGIRCCYRTAAAMRVGLAVQSPRSHGLRIRSQIQRTRRIRSAPAPSTGTRRAPSARPRRATRRARGAVQNDGMETNCRKPQPLHSSAGSQRSSFRQRISRRSRRSRRSRCSRSGSSENNSKGARPLPMPSPLRPAHSATPRSSCS